MSKKRAPGMLSQMHEQMKKFDPLSGPNVMRYARHFFRDNGDGTITIVRPRLGYGNMTAPPEVAAARSALMDNLPMGERLIPKPQK